MLKVEIINYEDKYQEDLKRLSMEWLLKYELLEPEDEKIINNPKGEVLNNGGYIFFARCNGEIVGTASLINDEDESFELAKLSVTESHQGTGIGQRLIEKCLETAKIEKAGKVILYTNHKLTAAVSLYKKYDFKMVPDFSNEKYVESDMKMELSL